jgi:hypothetical protein
VPTGGALGYTPIRPLLLRIFLVSQACQKGSTQWNATELARDKFKALFAAHDAKNKPASAQQQKLALKTGEKAATKKVKPLDGARGSRRWN